MNIKFITTRLLKRNNVVMDVVVRKMEFLAMIRSQLRRTEGSCGRRIIKRKQNIIDTNNAENWEISNIGAIKKRGCFLKSSVKPEKMDLRSILRLNENCDNREPGDNVRGACCIF